MSTVAKRNGHDAEALGRLTSAAGELPGRLTPTEAFCVVTEAEGGVDRSGGSGGSGDERPSAKGRSPLVREPALARDDSASMTSRSKPGASNTRRNTPPEAQYGGAEFDDSHHHGRTRPLAARVDALVIAYHATIRSDVREHLEACLVDLKANGAACATIGGNPFALARKSRSGWWNLQGGTCHVIVSDSADGWSVEVKLLAAALAVNGLKACIDVARDVAYALIDNATEERVRRVDLCADFIGFGLDDLESSQLLTPRRASVTQHLTDSTRAVHTKRDLCTGFTIGRGSFGARIYDKTREMIDKRNDEKRSIEHTLWRQGAQKWNGSDRVTRVEFQLRGDALKELWDGSLRDPDRLLVRVDSIWQYGCRDWLRLIDLNSATRRHRCANDPRWLAVQSVRFTDHVIEEPLRVRRRGAARAKFTLGACLSLGARAGLVDELIALKDGEERGDARSEILLRTALRRFGDAVGADIATVFVEELGGGRLALAAVIARAEAACARVTAIVPPRSWTGSLA